MAGSCLRTFKEADLEGSFYFLGFGPFLILLSKLRSKPYVNDWWLLMTMRERVDEVTSYLR
jgi:hypothetical protein